MAQQEFKTVLRSLLTAFMQGDLDFKNVPRSTTMINKLKLHVEYGIYTSLRLRLFPRGFASQEQFALYITGILLFEHSILQKFNGVQISGQNFFLPLLNRSLSKAIVQAAIILNQGRDIQAFKTCYIGDLYEDDIIGFINSIPVLTRKTLQRQDEAVSSPVIAPDFLMSAGSLVKPEQQSDAATNSLTLSTAVPRSISLIQEQFNVAAPQDNSDHDFFDFGDQFYCFDYEEYQCASVLNDFSLNDTPCADQQAPIPTPAKRKSTKSQNLMVEISQNMRKYLNFAPQIRQESQPPEHDALMNKILFKTNNVNPLHKKKVVARPIRK